MREVRTSAHARPRPAVSGSAVTTVVVTVLFPMTGHAVEPSVVAMARYAVENMAICISPAREETLLS